MTAAHHQNPALRRGRARGHDKGGGKRGKELASHHVRLAFLPNLCRSFDLAQNRHLLADMRVDGVLLWE